MKHSLISSFALLALTSTALAACSSDPGETTTSTSSTGAASSTTGAGGESSSATSGAGGSASASSTGVGGNVAAACTATMFGDDRPVSLHVPKSYSCDTGAPLLIMLHGYGATGSLENFYLKVTAESDKRGFLYAYPDGTKDTDGKGFWNATDACCNFYGSTIDDSAYITKIITDVQAAYKVDPKRIFLLGHSNGGFMSYRMACEHGDLIAGIASLAGAMYADTKKCAAENPVSVLQIHGTSDETVTYTGGVFVNSYPSATTTVGDWVANDGCGTTPDTSAAPIDLESSLAGAETKITSYTGCKSGTGVSLWTIEGGSHIPTFTPEFIPGVLDFLYAHPKP